MGELTLVAVVVVDAVKQLLVIVGPQLEGITVTVHARSDIGSNQGSLYEEGARAAHRVYQVSLAIPPAQQDNAGSQHLVDGRIGLASAPPALEQRLTAAVERQGHITARDVHIDTDFGIGQADARTLAVLVIKEIGNRILHAISDKTRVVEILAIDGSINRKCRVHGQQLFPVEGLELLIQVIGTRRFQRQERLEHAHRSAAGKICLIKHLLIAPERNHTITFGHLFSAQGTQLVGKHTFKTHEGFCHHIKFVSHHVLIIY